MCFKTQIEGIGKFSVRGHAFPGFKSSMAECGHHATTQGAGVPGQLWSKHSRASPKGELLCSHHPVGCALQLLLPSLGDGRGICALLHACMQIRNVHCVLLDVLYLVLLLALADEITLPWVHEFPWRFCRNLFSGSHIYVHFFLASPAVFPVATLALYLLVIAWLR